MSKTEALEHLPTLDTDHLVAGFLYFDARADDARLTLTILRTAALEFGAAVANYSPVVRLITGSDGAPTARSCGRTPPTRRPTLSSGPGSVVNATGVWADTVRALDEGTTRTPSVRPRACM